MRKLTYLLSLLLIFTIPWETVVEDETLGSITRLMGFALAASWALMVVTTGRIRRPTPFHVAVLLLVLWNAVSIFWSGNGARTSQHILTWVQLAAMVFILWDLFVTRAAFQSGLQAYILGAYVVFGNTIANFFSGNTYYWERFSAEGTNPDDLGIVLALGIPVAWYLAGRKSVVPGGFLLKWANYAYIPAALLGIALSGTRTALIAAIPGILFGLLSISRVSLWAKAALAVLFVAATFLITPLVPQASFDRLGSTGTEVFQGNWNGRLDIWGQGIDSLAEHPFIGVGSNMFRSVNVEGKVAHNSFLSILVELGLIGFSLFAFILLIVFMQAARLPRWDALFWFSTLAIWAIGAFALTWEYRKPTWLFLSLVIVGAALAVPGQEKAQPVPTGQQSEVKSPGAVPRPIRRQEIHIRAPQSR